MCVITCCCRSLGTFPDVQYIERQKLCMSHFSPYLFCSGFDDSSIFPPFFFSTVKRSSWEADNSIENMTRVDDIKSYARATEWRPRRRQSHVNARNYHLSEKAIKVWAGEVKFEFNYHVHYCVNIWLVPWTMSCSCPMHIFYVARLHVKLKTISSHFSFFFGVLELKWNRVRVADIDMIIYTS